MYSYGPPHMAGQKQDDQHEHTFSSYVRIRDVALKTCQRWWTIGRSGERGSWISMLAARHDDDEVLFYQYSCCNIIKTASNGEVRLQFWVVTSLFSSTGLLSVFYLISVILRNLQSQFFLISSNLPLKFFSVLQDSSQYSSGQLSKVSMLNSKTAFL